MPFWTRRTKLAKLQRDNKIMREALDEVAYGMTEFWNQKRIRKVAHIALGKVIAPRPNTKE